jgi:hypothetical protein
MPKHDGVYKKGNKYYGAKWYKGKTYTTALFSTATEASEARQVLIRKLTKGVDLNKKNITIQDFTSRYLQNYIHGKRLDPITIKSIENRIKNGIFPLIGNKKLSSLTPEDIQDVQNKLYSKYSEGYAHQIMCQLRRMLKRAVIWEYIERDPSLGLDTIGATRK